MIEALRMPAGDEPRFASAEGIAANRQEFVARVHGTWKAIHADAISEIVRIEMLLAKRNGAWPKGCEAYLRLLCRIWRRVNDAIAWVVISEPVHVRRLCGHRARPTLVDSNPTSVAAILDEINSDPQSIALWSDATTFVDVGDVLTRRNGGPLEFLELKEGRVNEAIWHLQEEVRGAGEEATTKAIEGFVAAYGRKGLEQAERVAKQMVRDSKVMNLLNSDKGPDPDRDVEIETFESNQPTRGYDDELGRCIEEAGADGSATACVDGCLWIHVFRRPDLPREAAIAEFSARVFAASPETKAWLQDRLRRDVLHPVGTVDQWSFVPTAVPLFLRPLQTDHVLDICYGRLTGRVLLFFDWLRFW